jgi:hypothetical protein
MGLYDALSNFCKFFKNFKINVVLQIYCLIQSMPYVLYSYVLDFDKITPS